MRTITNPTATNSDVRAAVEQTIRAKLKRAINYLCTKTKPSIVCMLGAIFKPNAPEVHLIRDCSSVLGYTLSDYYMTTRSFKFQTLDDGVNLLQPNYFVVKIDLRHAYRSVQIHPSTGLKWQFAG